MGLRFRKSIKIAPGVKLNLGKKSAGISIGGKHGGISYNTRTGTRARVSAPGTGLSYSTKVSGTSKKSGNSSTASATNIVGIEKNKWVAFSLCLFLGYFGAHKFYEGKSGMGILYLFTVGLFGIGWMVDSILLLLKPNPYYI